MFVDFVSLVFEKIVDENFSVFHEKNDYIFFNCYQEDKEKDYMLIGLVIYIGIVSQASLVILKSSNLRSAFVALYPSCLIMARKL